MNNGVVLNIDELNKQIQMMSGKELNKIERSSIRKGLNVLKREAKKSLRAKLPAANNRNPKYNDTLMQGVMSSVKVLNDSTMIGKVHIMGSNKSGSGTFRLRFFETGTKQLRKDGSSYGINKGNKKLGTHNNYQFFDSVVNSSNSKSTEAMFTELKKRIKEISNG